MRTTVDLADDVAAEVARLRRDKGLGLSAAVNELARAGLRSPASRYTYSQQTFDMGARVDLSNVGDLLELLDEGGEDESRHAG